MNQASMHLYNKDFIRGWGLWPILHPITGLTSHCFSKSISNKSMKRKFKVGVESWNAFFSCRDVLAQVRASTCSYHTPMFSWIAHPVLTVVLWGKIHSSFNRWGNWDSHTGLPKDRKLENCGSVGIKTQLA
jgi:hypothetical protein